MADKARFAPLVPDSARRRKKQKEGMKKREKRAQFRQVVEKGSQEKAEDRNIRKRGRSFTERFGIK